LDITRPDRDWFLFHRTGIIGKENRTTKQKLSVKGQRFVISLGEDSLMRGFYVGTQGVRSRGSREFSLPTICKDL
jgi:hypothetical protein